MRSAAGTDRLIAVEHIFISAGHNFFGHFGVPAGTHPAVAVDAVECVAGRGLRGDRFFGYRPEYKGQVTFFSLEVFAALSAEFGLQNTSPATVRRNIFVRGIDLNELIGTNFRLQGVEFEGIDECRPCAWMNQALAPGAEQWMFGRGGLRCRVRTDGWISCTSAPLTVLESGVKEPAKAGTTYPTPAPKLE